MQSRKRKRMSINIPKHKGQNLSFAQKHEICERYAKRPRPSQRDLADEYCVCQSSISLKSVLESVDNLLQFVSNPPKELLFDPKTLSTLRILRSKVSRYQIDTLHQSQIDRFITS
jgi:hypothetical protein